MSPAEETLEIVNELGMHARAATKFVQTANRFKSEIHVEKDVTKDARTGTIVWIKPSIRADDPAEVRQYSLENTIFPQQTTADQWFDEAQFESYRRLGEACAEAAWAEEKVVHAFR